MRVAAAADVDGVVINNAVVETRFGFLLELVHRLSESLLTDLWSTLSLANINGGVDADGRDLPRSAEVLARRLGWHPTPLPGVHCSSRVMRMAQANVVQTLRSQATREVLLPAVIAAMNPSGQVDRAKLPESAAYVRQEYLDNLARQVAAARKRDGEDPTSIVQIQRRPEMSPLAMFGTVDKQFAALDLVEDHLQVTVLLPVCAAPTRADWGWHTVMFRIPAYVALQHPDIVSWHLPTLSRDDRGRAFFRFAVTSRVPDPATAAAVRALGVDWSPKHLGVAGVVRQDEHHALFTDARPYLYNDRGLSAKLERLQREGEHLTAKIKRIGKLAKNQQDPVIRVLLEAAIEKLKVARTAVGAKRQQINRDLAFHFAATMVDLAVASGCTVIAVEDLKSLTAGGIGPYNNNKTAQSARSMAVDALAHTAAKAGIEVVTCQARGTSANCPGCDQPVTRPRGHYSAVCRPCGIDTDRDTAAFQNIAKRVLLAKTAVKRPHGKHAKVVGTPHAPVKKTRDKLLATPKQRRHKRCRPHVPTHPVGRKTTHQKPARLPSTRVPVKAPSASRMKRRTAATSTQLGSK